MATHFGGRWVIVSEQGVIRIERRLEDNDTVLLTAKVTADEGREIAALLIKLADEIDGKNEEILPTK